MAVERLTDYTRRIWTGLSADAPDPDMQAGDVIYYMDTSKCSIITGIPAPGSIDTKDLPDIGGGGGGGGLYELLASGSYVQASDLGNDNLEIPVSVSGVAVEYYVATAPTTSIAQTHAWYRTQSRPEITEIPRLTALAMHNAGASAAYYNGSIAVNGYPLATWVDKFTNPTMLSCRRYSNAAPIRAGTYNWYVWGYRT